MEEINTWMQNRETEAIISDITQKTQYDNICFLLGVTKIDGVGL